MQGDCMHCGSTHHRTLEHSESEMTTPALPSEPEVIKRLDSAVRNYPTWDGKCRLAQPIETLNEAREVLNHITQLRARCAQLEEDSWPLRDCLRKLRHAAHILLFQRDYNGAGWEEISAAYYATAKYVSEDSQALTARSTPTASEGT